MIRSGDLRRQAETDEGRMGKGLRGSRLPFLSSERVLDHEEHSTLCVVQPEGPFHLKEVVSVLGPGTIRGVVRQKGYPP